MGKEKLDFLLAQHCAPTLVGLKAASMVALGCTAIVSGYDNCIRQACQGLENGVSLQAMIHKAA